MILIECYVESFGKIKDKRIVFSEGLNSILDNNGAGKTTLATFIKVMLYGMSDTKKMSLDENDRKHYLPWDGSAARGTLTFRVGEREYRIERGFAPKAADDTFTLYDTSTGKVTEDFSERLGEELFGIDADGFERTVFLSERALTPRSENKSISAKLSDLVGCDGDIGVMDNAMKALEEGRKFYYKKGGTGELANIKSSIAETAKRLEHLRTSEEGLYEIEKRQEELRRMLGKLETERSALLKEREGATLASAKAGILRHIEELRGEIASLSEKRTAHLAFFGNKIPEHSEINDAELKLREAARLAGDCTQGENPEYRELATYLADKTDEGEIAELKGAIYETKRKKSLAVSEEAKKLQNRFSKRIPSHAELDELIKLASRGKKKAAKRPNVAMLLAGAVASVGGVCLGIFVNLAFFLLLAIGGVIFALALIGGKAKNDEDASARFRDFYFSVSGVSAPSEEELLSDLIEMKGAIDRASALESECRSGEAERRLCAFAEKFGFVSGEVTEFSEDIIAKYERFNSLKAAESYRLGEEKKKRERGEKLRLEAETFIGRYPTETSAPCDEIRERLTEYERLCALITAKEREEAKLVLQYGDAESSAPPRQSEEIDRDLAAAEEKIASVQHETAISEKIRMQYSVELEEKESVAMKLTSLRELYEKHSENYNVILKTKEYLERAKDSMTAKYLGKTKSGFEKYTELIGGVSDERFEMSTDFGTSKLEGATAKSTEAYSRGTKDLYNLAARLALVDSLYEGEEPFIILDDPFVSFDDEKISSALKLLSDLGKDRQIIYFTCSKSRAV